MQEVIFNFNVLVLLYANRVPVSGADNTAVLCCPLSIFYSRLRTVLCPVDSAKALTLKSPITFLAQTAKFAS